MTVPPSGQPGAKATLAKAFPVSFGARRPSEPNASGGDLLDVRPADAPAGATCDLSVRKEKGEFAVTRQVYARALGNDDHALFAACMHELLYACGLTPDEEADRLATVQKMLRTLDDKFLKTQWIEPNPNLNHPLRRLAALLPLHLFGVKSPQPFTMGDMALNLMVVYGTPQDVEACIKDRKIDPNGFSPVSFHREYPTPLHRAVDARKPDNIAVLLKYLKPEHLRVVNRYQENALQYARFHQSDKSTMKMLTKAYREAGL